MARQPAEQHVGMGPVAVWAIATLLLGGLLFVAFEYYALEFLGEGECDRADCSWIGDLAYGSSAGVVLGLSWVLAGALVWAAGRVLLRRPGG